MGDFVGNDAFMVTCPACDLPVVLGKNDELSVLYNGSTLQCVHPEPQSMDAEAEDVATGVVADHVGQIMFGSSERAGGKGTDDRRTDHGR